MLFVTHACLIALAQEICCLSAMRIDLHVRARRSARKAVYGSSSIPEGIRTCHMDQIKGALNHGAAISDVPLLGTT